MSDIKWAGEPQELLAVTRRDAALLRAAASLAAFTERRRNAGHLADSLGELADRIEALFPPAEAA